MNSIYNSLLFCLWRYWDSLFRIFRNPISFMGIAN